MLARCGGGFGTLGLAGALAPPAAAGSGAGEARLGMHYTPRARRVIFLFMNGGPSHVDSFDPKPKLRDVAGQMPSGELYRKTKGNSGFLPSSFRFRPQGECGMEVSELFPHLGSLADDLCVVRSMHTDVPNHEPALLMMSSGHLQPVRPSLGAWLLYGLGNENENLPGYVVLRGAPRIVVGPQLWSSGFLPGEYQGTDVLTHDMRVQQLVENLRPPPAIAGGQQARLDLLRQFNQLHRARRSDDDRLEAEIQAMELAARMQIEASEAFDIRHEPQSVRDRYGSTPFAHSCLLARRLAERGVRFIQVYYTRSDGYAPLQPWDTHKNNDGNHRALAADADRASAALLADLKARGMLDDTLVLWGGEFGRTPYAEKQNDKAKFGRDHHHTAFSMLLAGGGVRGGHVHGASDELGMHAVEQPVHVHDLHATILHLMGIDHKRLTYHYSGRDFRLTDVHGRVVREILL